MVKAIVGANWGDEGKGKITDMLAEESDIIVRFQEELMRDILLLMIMESSRFIFYLREFSITIQQVSLATA